MLFKYFLCILIILSQGLLRAESLSLPNDVLDKLRSITQYLDSMTDASVFDYIYRINRGAGLNLFEGDINGYNPKHSHLRTAITNHQQLWNTRVVPYVIDSSFDSSSRKDIEAAIEEYHQKTCIRWVPRTNEHDYVHFKQISGCFSNIGRTGGEQEISLMGACLKKGTAVHEMMHALGFWHEQSRPDRDFYVHVITSNIQDGKEYNFEKLDATEADTLGVQYDYGSVMHYSKYAFTKNGNPTLMPTQPTGAEIGQRDGLSDLDIERIRKLYGCNYPVPTQPPTTTKYIETKPAETKAPVTKPPVTNPPQTQPPPTNLPTTKPPVTNPPLTNPPQTQPPVTNPPQTNPPQTHPAVTQEPPTNTPYTERHTTQAPPSNPPQTQHSITNHPPSNPPSTQAPVTSPPVTNPPQTEPLMPVYQLGWTLWSEWSPCDLRCKHSRYRFCMNYDRNYCLGSNSEVADCPYPCKPASSLGCWSQDRAHLSIPSAEGLSPPLSDSYKDRTEAVRKCSNYASLLGYNIFALFDGGQCLTGPNAVNQFSNKGASSMCNYKGVGSAQAMNVYTFDQNIDGQWSVWSDWGYCTKSCGLGRQYRYRRCDNPPPIGNGAVCTGESQEVAVCNMGICLTPIKCGSRYYAGSPGSSGVIWMRDYENFMECEYEIATVDPLATISIFIHQIDVEYSRGCVYDSLMLYDGYNRRAPLVGTFCGNTAPGTFESSSNNLYLRFTSDETNTGHGFTVFYTINSRSSKACVKPPPSAHASISMEGNMVGQRVWYTCHPGYKMVGHSPITCIDQPGFALWDDNFPRCVYTRKRSVTETLERKCSFQDSLCGYINEPGNDFDWVVRRSTNTTDNSTSLQGNVLHAESNVLLAPGALARIRTEAFSGFYTNNCLSFKYKIDGGIMAKFNVYTANVVPKRVDSMYITSDTVDDLSMKLIYTENGKEDSRWHIATQDVRSDRDFQVIFEAALGNEIGSSVSLDDVVVTRGQCQ